MAKTQSQEERQLLKLVGQLPVAEEDKAAWTEQISRGDMNEELAETIRTRLAAPAEGQDPTSNQRSRYQVEFANLVRRWRLSNQARNFGRR